MYNLDNLYEKEGNIKLAKKYYCFTIEKSNSYNEIYMDYYIKFCNKIPDIL